jgi:hypothetical protein
MRTPLTFQTICSIMFAEVNSIMTACTPKRYHPVRDRVPPEYTDPPHSSRHLHCTKRSAVQVSTL